MSEIKLDSKDFEILAALKENAKQSVLQLSKKTKIPPTTIHNRMKKLKKNKVITGYTIRINREKMGLDVCALIFVYVDNTQLEPESKKGGLAEKLSKHHQVDEVFEIAGNIDVIVKVYGKTINDITDFVLHNIREVKGVRRTETVIALTERKK